MSQSLRTFLVETRNDRLNVEGVSLLGVETVLRLARDSGSTIIEYAS